MQIPMILFVITIERKQFSSEEKENRYKLEQTLRELENERWKRISQLPEYYTRL